MKLKPAGKTCARCGRIYGGLQVAVCPNEAVNHVYGKQICYYCCKRCKFHTKHPLCGAIGCNYLETKEGAT